MTRSRARRSPELAGWPSAGVTFVVAVFLGWMAVSRPGVALVVAALTIIAAIALFARPGLAWGILGLLVVFDGLFSRGLYVNGQVVFSATLAPSNVALVALGIRLWMSHRTRLVGVRRALALAAVGLLGLAWLSAVANGLSETWRMAVTLSGASLVIFLLSVAPPRYLQSLLKGMLMGAALLSLTAIATLVNSGPDTPLVGRAFGTLGGVPLPTTRVTGVLTSPNQLGFLLFVGFMLSQLLIVRAAHRWALALLCLAPIPFTYSRGAILATLLAGATYIALRVDRRAGASLERLFSIGVSLALAGWFISRILSWAQQQPYWNRTSINIRLDAWTVAWSTAVHHPLLGIGPGRFLAADPFQVVAHNTYLEMGADLGLPAAMIASGLAVLAVLGAGRRALLVSGSLVARTLATPALALGAVTFSMFFSMEGVKAFWIVVVAAIVGAEEGALPPAGDRDITVSRSPRRMPADTGMTPARTT